MNIHIVNKSPLQNSALDDALRLVTSGDHLVLMDDGVYAAMGGTSAEKAILESGCRCIFLEQDAITRGLMQTGPHCRKVTMREFVELVFMADKTITWS